MFFSVGKVGCGFLILVSVYYIIDKFYTMVQMNLTYKKIKVKKDELNRRKKALEERFENL